MAEIEITLTKKNLRLLIKHVFIGNWILTATKTEENKELDDFFDSMLSLGKSYNILDGIEYDEKTGSYDLTREKEEELLNPVNEFEEDNFWDELINKLAIRDAKKKYGINELSKMESTDRMKVIWDEEEKYKEEFEKNGIERLALK